MKKQNGSMLIDLLVSVFISLLAGAGLVTLYMTTTKMQTTYLGQTDVDAQARQALNVLSDSVMDAYSYQTVASPAQFSAVQAASTNSITCYTNSSGAYTKYWFDSANKQLKKTTSTNVTTIMVRNVTALTFTYYKTSGNYNDTSANWVTTTNPNAPTNAELCFIGAVKIVETVTVNGLTRQFSTLARLRNSPS